MLNSLYKCAGFFWEIQEFSYVTSNNVIGPFCIICRNELDITPPFYVFSDGGEVVYDRTWKGHAHCLNCNKDFKLETNLEDLRKKVARQYMIKIREGYKVHFLDEPPTQLKANEENEKYFVSVKFQERDGKKQGVVYFGEKTAKQSKKDYAQVFIDFENQAVRFDQSNKHPNDVAKSVKTIFKKSGKKVRFERSHTMK